MSPMNSTDVRPRRPRLAGRALRGAAAASVAFAVALARVAANPAGGPVIPASPISWGNAIYADLAVGQSCGFLGRQVRLVAVQGDHCTIAVDGVSARLRMARRDRPKIVNGVRTFVADTRAVAQLTTDQAFPSTHGAMKRDALLCLSDPARPLLDPARFTFPISRDNDYRWTMDENSGMFAYLSPERSHEGIDLNLHEARGAELHPLVAIEDGTVRWARPTGRPQEACLLLESTAQPGLYYVYQHLNVDRLQVKSGDTVQRGQRLAYIWGDWRWGHLHFAVLATDAAPGYAERYANVLNCFPQLYELWHGSLEPVAPPVTSGRFRFAEIYYRCEGRLRLHAFSDTVGYGWLLGDWCAAGSVEYLRNHQPGQSARSSKIMHAESGAPALNPDGWLDFEVAVENGRYRVEAEVGDAYADTRQRIAFEGVDAGSFALAAGQLQWTPSRIVGVQDGRLTVRIYLIDQMAKAAVRNLNFAKVEQSGREEQSL